MNVPQYIENITERAKDCFSIAQKARLKGYDPQRTVDIPLVKNVGERVEGLVGSVVPGIVGKGIPDRIKELENQYGTGDWRVSFVISAEVAKQKFCKFESNEKAMEIAVRVGLAYITLGIVSAPLEGFVELKIRKRRDGGEYVSCYYAGPIRASGGTAAAVSVLIADYVRKEMGYAMYDPDENEINRYMTEIEDYHTRVARLQYHATKEELSMLLNKVPIEINGDPTATIDVSNYKDLPRIETNSIRGGMCLVVAEGLCLKAKKVFKNVKKWGKEFGMEHWNFLDGFLKLQTEIHSRGAAGETKESDSEIKPNYRYLEATVAGRPVLSYPLETGGFRIRYGRSRLSGLAGDSMHPATMILLNGFIATGTQLAVERPGKATVITPCDSIEGPVVKLKNGDVLRVNDVETAKKVKDNILQIIFLGDILSNYGDFSQNSQKLIPSGYVEEWWIQELERTKAKEELPKEFFNKNNFMYKFPSPGEAVKLSEKYNVPLHPKYTYHWHDIKKEEVIELVKWISKSESISNSKIVLENSDKKLILETLCIPHKVINNMIIIEEDSNPLLFSLGYYKENKFNIETIEKLEKESTNALELINKLSPVKIRAKAPIYLGCRMGRPEKAKMRAMKGSPHCLFPCGEEGGRHRSFNAAMEKGKVRGDFAFFQCEKCSNISAFQFCQKCGSTAKLVKKCTNCGKYVEEDMHCGNKTQKYERRDIPILEYIRFSEAYLKETIPELVKGVKGMSSESKVAENLIKGILRAKHDVYVNKDGTIRFDMTEAPITHFYPKEIGISLKKLKELGYEKDIYGKPIESEEQLVELFPQDIIMPQCEELEEACSVTSILKICNFIDELLIKFYKQEPYYNVKTKNDLIGQLVVCLAPHTSAGILGRIIGFSNTQCFFAHPYLHCATRRNCLPGYETVLIKSSNHWKLPTFSELDGKELSELRVQEINGTDLEKTNKIKGLIKTKSPGTIISFKLEAGREIETTPEHKMLILEGDRLVKKKSVDVKIGDKMITLAKLNVEKPLNFINVLEWYKNTKEKEKIRLHNLKKEVKKKIKRNKGLAKYLDSLSWRKNLGRNKQYKAVSIAIEKDALPFGLFEELKLENKNVEISYNRQKARIKPRIPLNYKTGFLVGLLLSDGYIRTTKKEDNQKKFVYQTVWSISDKSVLHEIIAFCKDNFGKPTIRERKDKICDVILSGRVYYDFFANILKTNKGALNKRLPYDILNSNLDCVKGCLSGYIAGDGSIDKKHGEVIISSSNKNLINDIGTLSLRLNLFPYYKKEERKLTKGKVADFYKKKNIDYKYTSYKLRFNSSDSRKILNFMIGEKKSKLKQCLNKFNSKGNRFKKFKDFVVLSVKNKQEVKSKSEYVYDLEIESKDKTYFAGLGNIAVWDCDGDEDGIIMLMDAFLNFSRDFLPNKRGSKTMDAPLVLTTCLDPLEIDDEVYAMDVVDNYPLEFYEVTQTYKYSGDVTLIKQVKDRLGKPEQYEGLMFTHPTSSINLGVKVSSYKSLKTMEDKIKMQMDLARKIKAVKESNMAGLIINNHFLRDIKGNLRKFSEQEFRCVACNEKFRRVPLVGRCTKCNGKIIFTVSEGFVNKYMQSSLNLSENYHLDEYLKQTLEILKRKVDSLFGWETEKQTGLAEFFGAKSANKTKV